MPIRKNVLIVLIVLLAAATILLVVLVNKNKKGSIFKRAIPVQQNIREESTFNSGDLEGIVYLTLKNKETQKMGIYSLDLLTGKLEDIFVPEADCYILGGEISPAGDEMAISSSCFGYSDGGQIGILNLDRRLIGGVTTSDKINKREAFWDKNGNLFFSAQLTKNNNNVNWQTRGWGIFETDMDGEEKLLAELVHPMISPDGSKMLAVDQLGVFLFETTGESKGKLVHSFGEPAQISTQIDLSDDGTLLALSHADSDYIDVFKIESWEDFKMSKTASLKKNSVSLSWPKISSDNKYILGEELTSTGNVNLVYFDINSGAKNRIVNLDDYRHDSMWINDWRQ